MHLYKNIIIHAGHFVKPLNLQNYLILGIQIISKRRIIIVFIGIIIHNNFLYLLVELYNNSTNIIPGINYSQD